MRYLLLFNKDEAKFRALSDEARAELIARYERYGVDMIEAGIVRGGSALQGSDTATTVRVRDGKRLVTDGPFAETAEALAGYAEIEVDNLDEAMEWAAKHPDAEWGSVEVRVVLPWEPPRGSG